jgi:hypothetical protein
MSCSYGVTPAIAYFGVSLVPSWCQPMTVSTSVLLSLNFDVHFAARSEVRPESV